MRIFSVTIAIVLLFGRAKSPNNDVLKTRNSTTISLENNWWKVGINNAGQLTSLAYKHANEWNEVPVQRDTCKGVNWYLVNGNKPEYLLSERTDDSSYSTTLGDVSLNLKYALEGDKLVIIATANNEGKTLFSPQKLGLQMGISNYMDKYPRWNNVFFPTMLRCEKAHFTGYLMTPNGAVLSLVSPDPVASYSLVYNYGYGNIDSNYFWGHRIYGFNLDLINDGPLPERHPQNLNKIAPGETKTWKIYIQNSSLDKINASFAQLSEAPSFDIPQTTLEEAKAINYTIYSSTSNKLFVTSPNGQTKQLSIKQINTNTYSGVYLPDAGPGVYKLVATNTNGKATHALISVRKPWDWYLQKAREAAITYTQKASFNCENWYGFYSAYLARTYFPNKELDKKIDDRFDLVMSLLYDTTNNWKPTKNIHRIQNHSTNIGILVDKYIATREIKDLKIAAALADHLITNTQSKDGAFRNGLVNYTSVIYTAKSMMELMKEEKKLSESDAFWKAAYERHYVSVKKAIDQLALGMGGIATEGELTFEDGMISCTALQLASFALLQKDEKEKERYTKIALEYLDQHRCLEQLKIADARSRGGTMRFWEAQYDVLLGSNFMSSPHGWTAWTIYGRYYAYLLTGNENYLVETMNALGSCVQLIDFKSGKLRWAFATDPYINTVQGGVFENSNPDVYNDNQYSPYEGKQKKLVFGEQYVDMIADKYNANSSDNDVHEIFKCMEEVALTSAYVVKQKDGSLLSYNCMATQKKGDVEITIDQPTVSKIHVNDLKGMVLKIHWKNSKRSSAFTVNTKLEWIYK